MTDDPLIWNKARAAMPLLEVIRAEGRGDCIPSKHGGPNRQLECPFCQRKGKWGVGIKGDRWWFKCAHPACDAHDGPAGQGEIGFIALARGIPQKTACTEYLKMAVPELVPHLFEDSKPSAPSEPKPKPRPKPAQEPKNPWDELVMKLPLTGPDSERILKKRGLSPESQDIFCLRSNNPANRAIVASLADRWTEEKLVEIGILKHKRGQAPYPAGQLCGWGRTGKWVKGGDKAADEHDEQEWSEDVEPPLIPYFGTDGIPFYVRPHKGGITNDEKKELEDSECFLDDDDATEERECAAHVWFPPNFRDLLELCDGVAVLTEGEFKAMAACQAGIACCASPGISFIRNPAFKRELIKSLQTYGVRELVVIFDNEVKDDPRLPNYKADPQKRCDTEIYAELTMRELHPHFANIGGRVLVGQLPEKWEDGDVRMNLRDAGKTDFDGILAKCVGELGIADGTKRARRIFRSAIHEASDQPNRDLFATQKRKAIERGIHMRYVKRRVPFGGAKEWKIALRMEEWDDEAQEQVDKELASALKAIRGKYYEWKNPPKSTEKDEPPPGTRQHYTLVLIPEVEGLIQAAKEQKKYDRLRILNAKLSALYMRLKGLPEEISTCVIRGQFKLHTPGAQTCRMVQVFDSRVTGRGRQPILRKLDPKHCKSAGEFQEWVQGTGEGDWMGGKSALDMLVADINDQLFERDIHAVTNAGHHAGTKCWFYGDSAYMDDLSSKEGRSIEIFPDDNGVFWIDGTGYMLDIAADDPEASKFSLGFPLLHSPQGMKTSNLFDEGNLGDLLETQIYEHNKIPRLCAHCEPLLKLCKAMREGDEKESIETMLAACSIEPVAVDSPVLKDPQGRAQLETIPFRDFIEREIVSICIETMATCLRITIGDYDAWAAIGGILAFNLGPELVSEYHCHPGLWLSGPFGDGKSDTLLMLTRMMGLKDKALKLTKDLTAVGMNRTLAQYGSLPVPFDEFRRDMEDVKAREHVMRSATERGASPKGTIQDATSTRSIPIRTSPVVSGEHSSEDPATRSRFLHIAVNKARRQPGSLAAWEKLKAFRPHFYHIGRWVIKRRRAFAAETLKQVREWMGDAEVKTAIDKERIRLSTGVGYCAFNTIAGMLGLYDIGRPLEARKPDFRACMVKIGGSASSNATQETFRNQFWREILNGIGRGTSGIKTDFFSIRMCWLKDEKGTLLPSNTVPDYSAASVIEGVPPSAGAFFKQQLATRKFRLAVLSETQAQTFATALPVMFVSHGELFAEYQRDARTQGQTARIGLTDLLTECKEEDWFLPGQHIQKLGTDKGSTRCWAIALDTFQFAQDFLLRLSTENDPPYLAALTKRAEQGAQ